MRDIAVTARRSKVGGRKRGPQLTIDLSSIARSLQPAAILAITNKLLKQVNTQPRRPRRERRSMNG